MSNVQTQGVETLQVNLSREHQGVPWGFRLTGGRDFANALAIQLVQPNSVAEVQGLCAGDGVLSINNIPSDELEHEQAKQEIMRSGNNVQFLVQRGGVTIWKPKVTPLSDLRPDQTTLPTGEQVVQRTSLAANQGPVHHIGSAHNRAARPFGGFGGGSGGGSCAPTNTYSGGPSQQQHAQQLHQQQAYAQQQAQQFNNPPPAPPSDAGSAGQGGTVPAMVHAQYNSPMGLYSQTNVADTYQAQAQGLVNKMSGMNVQDGGPSPTAQAVLGGGARTGGTRSVSAPVTRPGAGQKPKEQLNKCGECGMLIAGVFLKIKGIPLHAECFKCAQCGKMLKNIGYFHIEGRNYCELHAKQLTRPGYGGYEANVTYK